MTGPLTKKRRKDADEGNGRSKKFKFTGVLKRQLKPFTCRYCLQKGHTKRGYLKKRAANVVAAAAAVATAKKKLNTEENSAQGSTVDPNSVIADAVDAPAQTPPKAPTQAPHVITPVDVHVVEIVLSQQNYLDAQQSQEDPPTRPSKLQTRRRFSPPPSRSVNMDPLQGTSSATASRLANFLKFIATPDFKPPRKKK